MKSVILPIAIAALATTLGAPVYHSVYTPLHGSCQRSQEIQSAWFTASSTDREPTFNETRDFILRHTSTAWNDAPGNHHTYALTFAKKRLKFTHTFTSEYSPGFSEKFEVELSDLDPMQVGMKVQDGVYLSLATTNGENKVSVAIAASVPGDELHNRKFTQPTVFVPASNAAENQDQDKMDARLRKAWIHLIKLAGGKPSQEEPF